MGVKGGHEINQEIEALIKEKDAACDFYTDSDLDFISRYSGSGGKGDNGATGTGLLYEYYTPDYIGEYMWKLAYKYGYNGAGTVLEPSCGIGTLLRKAPDKSLCYGFETNPTSARIAQILNPKAKIYNQFFETAFLQPPRYSFRMSSVHTWLEGCPFSLVIGNPPFGKYRNKYSGYFTKPKFSQAEIFFMYYCLKLLKPGGLLVFLTGANFLRNGYSYNEEKLLIENLGIQLLDAYRLPPVIKGTSVPLDLIVLKK